MATPLQDRDLLAQLFSGGEPAEAAWKEFLQRYSNLFLKIIWQFERERDVAMDRYMFVCEKLAAKDFLVLRKFNPEEQKHAPKLSTWLTIVVRNMCVEAHRSTHGRRRYPQALLRLSPFDREIFRLSYWKGYSAEEIQQQIQARKNGSLSSVSSSLAKIDSMLTKASKKTLREKSPTVVVPLDEAKTDIAVVENQETHQMEEWFENSVQRLTEKERLVLRFRFWEDLTAAEIGSIMKISPLRKVYTILGTGLKKLRQEAKKEFVQ